MSSTVLEASVQNEMVDVLAGLGWRPVSRAEMNKLRHERMGEAIVEPLLIDALQSINEGLTQADAALVASHVRRAVDDEEFIEWLRDGITISLAPGEPDRTVRLIDLEHPERNDFVVTPEFELRTGATRQPRLDIVCLANGLPLGLIETKGPHESWKKAARDFAGYWQDAPELKKLGIACVATNGTKFRVGPSSAPGPSGYSAWKDCWPHPIPEDADEFTIGCLGVLDPHTLVDLAAHFIVFETREGKTTKKLARYQQYRATNKIVKRVLEGKHDRGLIWHTQGSGKSLTMVFAARKLMRVGLKRPTVIIVIDRTNLDTQINETLEACSFDGVYQALSRESLASLLEKDTRGVIVTTVHKFSEEIKALEGRENVIVFADEAHRTQEGDYGIWMRGALPKARFFGFTGTPVETSDRSTRKAFSPVIDGKYENYLDAYSIKQAIEDGATVQVIYEPGPVEWAVEGDKVDEVFEREFGHLSEEERAKLKQDAARRTVVAKAPARMKVLAEDIARYLKDKLGPTGFKAQLVAVDREACVAYAELLSESLDPREFAVIYSGDKDDDQQRRHWYAAPQWERLTGAKLGEELAMEKLVEEFKKADSKLRLLIVNNMLLTGFDAPVEQVMFLDRGLKAHGLLQAIARTNRPAEGKDFGAVVDYWGVFSQLKAALAEFSPEDVELAATSIEELKEQFPEALAEAHAVVAAMPAGKTERQQMAWIVGHLEDPERAERFEQRFKRVQALYDAIHPDPFLVGYLPSYKQLVHLHAVWRHGSRQESDFDVAEYRPHTHALVQDAISVERLRRDLPVYRINQDYLSRLEGEDLEPGEKAAEIEAAIVHEIKTRGEGDPLAQKLSERLRKLRELQRRSDQMTLDVLRGLEEAVEEFNDDNRAREETGLSKRAYALVALARSAQRDADEDTLVELARQIEQRHAEVAKFAGWEKDIRHDLTKLLARDAKTRPLIATSFVDEAVNLLAADSGSDFVQPDAHTQPQQA